MRHGFVGKDTIRKHRLFPRFVTSWGSGVEMTTIRTNFDRFALARAPPAGLRIHHLMVDDLAIEPRRRPSPEDNLMRGYGRESDFTGVSVDVNSYSVLQALESAEEAERLRLGEELTVFSIGANHGEDYAISLTAAHATCKKGAKARDMAPTILANIQGWETVRPNNEVPWETRGPITTIAKDGASVMNQAVHPYVTQFTIDRTSAVGVQLFGQGGLGSLLFFDLCGHSATQPMVDVCDDKHWLKRLRMALKRQQGVKIGDFPFSRQLLTRLLVETGYDRTNVDTWFGEGEEDKQNVPAACKLMLALSTLAYKQPGDFPQQRRETPSFSQQLNALKIIGRIAELAFEFVTTQSASQALLGKREFLSLDALDRCASELGHIYFVCFRRNGSSFLPCQHYYNVQITIRGKYVSQAVSLALKLSEYWWYQDADDRLEGYFGMLRTLETGSNVDMVQFEERASELMRLDLIYTRNPDIKRGPRRLGGSLFDHMNPKSIGRAAASLASLSLPSTWSLGATAAAALLRRDSVFTAEECDWHAVSCEKYNGKSPDLVRPRGQWVGVDEADDDDSPAGGDGGAEKKS